MQDSTPEQIKHNLNIMLRKKTITESDVQLANYWINKWKELSNWINEDTNLPKKIKKKLT